MTLTRFGRTIVAGSLFAALTVPAVDAAATSDSASQSSRDQTTAGTVPGRSSSLPAPRTLSATLHDSSVGLEWSKVPGAQKYGVVVYPVGIQGPQRTRWVRGDRNYKPLRFKSLPTSGNGGFRMQVFAYADNFGNSAYTNIKIAQFKKRVVRKKEYTQDDDSKLRAALTVVKECGRDGLSVAVGTAVVGAPFVAFSIPIPGIGEVTATGLAAVAGIAGGGATVACFASNALGGN